jgi:hypothetical protein
MRLVHASKLFVDRRCFGVVPEPAFFQKERGNRIADMVSMRFLSVMIVRLPRDKVTYRSIPNSTNTSSVLRVTSLWTMIPLPTFLENGFNKSLKVK